MPAERAVQIRIDSEHCRAICDEIGDRLRDVLSRDTPEPTQYLLQLLARFEEQERGVPSIVPSPDDMRARPSIGILEPAI